MDHNITYNRRGLNITLKVQDETWRTLGVWKWNEGDKKAKASILRTLKEAFGISFKPTIDEDIDWLK